MTGERAWLDSGLLARQAAARIAGQLRDLRRRWPRLLADMQRMAAMRGEPGIPEWPDWCWLPMSAVGSHLTAAGDPVGTGVGVAAAAGLWRRLGRRIVVPSPMWPPPGSPGRAARTFPVWTCGSLVTHCSRTWPEPACTWSCRCRNTRRTGTRSADATCTWNTAPAGIVADPDGRAGRKQRMQAACKMLRSAYPGLAGAAGRVRPEQPGCKCAGIRSHSANSPLHNIHSYRYVLHTGWYGTPEWRRRGRCTAATSHAPRSGGGGMSDDQQFGDARRGVRIPLSGCTVRGLP